MSSGRTASRARRHVDRLRSDLVRGVVAVLPAALVVAVLYVWLPLATSSVLAAFAGLAVVAGVALTLVLGLERCAVLMLAGGFCAAPMNAVRPVPGLTFVTLSDLFLLVGVTLLLPVLVRLRMSRQQVFLLGAGGIFASSLVTSILSDDPVVSLNIIARLVVGALVLPMLFAVWRPDRRVVVVLAAAYVVGNVANVGYALTLGDASFEGRHIGLSMHVNILGFCAMLGLALIPFLLRELPARWGWVVVLAAGGCAYGVWVSGSRAALVVAVATGLLYPVVARSVPAAIALFGAGVVALWFVGNALIEGENSTNTLGRLFGAGSATASNQVREIEAQSAAEQFLDHPLLGGGFSVEILDAHNIYLQVAAAGGLVVLAFYLVLLGAVVSQSFRHGVRYHVLVLPAAAYILIGPLTPLLWDRYIWCVLALPFLLPSRHDDEDPDDDATPERVEKEMVAR